MMKPMPNPTPEMLNGDPLFEAIWQAIKTWDVNVPESYGGYCGATGSHVAVVYNAVKAAKRSPEDDLALARSMDDPNYQELVEEPKEE